MSESNIWSAHPYRVLSNTLVTPVICDLWLAPGADPLRFRAGQYVLLGDTDWRVPQRSYSVASAPRPDGRLSLLVTRVEGGPTSTWAHRLQPGDEVLLEGPYGLFTTAPERTGPLLLLGAGSGLAPLRALAEAVLREAPGRPVTLFFSCRSAADRIGADQLAAWQADHPQFRYLETLTRDVTAPRHGRLPPQLGQALGDLTGWEIFASGPSGFVVACAEAAQALGAAATDIHTEEFFTDPQPWLGTKPALPGAPDPNGDPSP